MKDYKFRIVGYHENGMPIGHVDLRPGVTKSAGGNHRAEYESVKRSAAYRNMLRSIKRRSTKRVPQRDTLKRRADALLEDVGALSASVQAHGVTPHDGNEQAALQSAARHVNPNYKGPITWAAFHLWKRRDLDREHEK